MSDRREEVFAWLNVHYKGNHWPEEAQRAWFGWYWTDARVLVARRAGRIEGVALVRACFDPVLADAEPDHHRDHGLIIFSDVAANIGGSASWAALIHCLRRRFPKARNIAFQRLGRAERVRLYNLDEFLTRLEHTHGKIHQS